MAKNTHAQEIATGTSDSYTEHEGSDPQPPATVRRAMLGELKEGDLSSSQPVGTRSLQFSESEQTSNEKQNPLHQPPAQTMENPSGPKVAEPVPDSTAPLTDGVGQKTQPQSSASNARKAAPGTGKKATPAKSNKARSRSLDASDDDEFDEFD